METPADRPLIRKVLDAFEKSEFRFKEMIVALMRERALLEQRAQLEPGEAAHVASNR